MAPSEHTERLCIYCRKIGIGSEPCPAIVNRKQNHDDAAQDIASAPSFGSGLTTEDYQLILRLQDEPSTFCTRCSEYDVIKLITDSQPRDSIQRHDDTSSQTRQYYEQIAPYRQYMGRPPSIHLAPSCQFCHLL